MAVLFANNATATLAAGISAAAVTIPLTTGQGARFPSPSGGDYFYATLVDASNNIEIVRCTGRAGDNLTVVRAQESTTARTYALGDKCELRVTAQGLNDLNALGDGMVTTIKLAASAVTDAKLATDAVTTAKIAAAAVTSVKIADSAITTAKIAAGAVTGDKLAAGIVAASLGFTPVRQGGVAELKFTWVEPYVYGFVNNVAQGRVMFEDTILGTSASGGYRGRPQIASAVTRTCAATDNGKLLVFTAGGVICWIPTNAAVPIEPGTEIVVASIGGAMTIGAAVGVSLTNPANGATGSRTLAAPGKVTLTKLFGDTWYVEGHGLS